MRNCRSKKKNSDRKKSDVNTFVATDGESREKVSRNKVMCESILDVDISDVWITDSKASRHITFRRKWFSEIRECQNIEISLGDTGE